MNALGAEIATASRGKVLNDNNTYNWHILTHKDMKFHSTELKSEGELGELLQFLYSKAIFIAQKKAPRYLSALIVLTFN